jgi:hypothetical protein
MTTSGVSQRKMALLRWEAASLQQSLVTRFDPPANGERRAVHLAPSGEYVTVQNFPLPDRFAPDFVDLLLLTDSFPAIPPVGIYVLNEGASAHVVRQLVGRFNAFRDTAYHGAPALPGYTWICYAYANNVWRYRADAPTHGDNIRKFLASFFAELSR